MNGRLLPQDDFTECPDCLPELDELGDVVQRMFPDSDTNPAGIGERAASILLLGHYHEGTLHQHGHPTTFTVYSRGLKKARTPVAELGGCRTCQDERDQILRFAGHLSPSFAANPERIEPKVLGICCRLMHWLGILHDLEHPVSLGDYSEAMKTGDFSTG